MIFWYYYLSWTKGRYQRLNWNLRTKHLAPSHSLLFNCVSEPLKCLVCSQHSRFPSPCLSLCPGQLPPKAHQSSLLHSSGSWTCGLESPAEILYLKHHGRLSRCQHQEWDTANWALPNNSVMLIKSPRRRMSAALTAMYTRKNKGKQSSRAGTNINDTAFHWAALNTNHAQHLSKCTDDKTPQITSRIRFFKLLWFEASGSIKNKQSSRETHYYMSMYWSQW